MKTELTDFRFEFAGYGHDTQSLDGWCLLVARSCKIGQTFQIGTIFDYHY